MCIEYLIFAVMNDIIRMKNCKKILNSLTGFMGIMQ